MNILVYRSGGPLEALTCTEKICKVFIVALHDELARRTTLHHGMMQASWITFFSANNIHENALAIESLSEDKCIFEGSLRERFCRGDLVPLGSNATKSCHTFRVGSPKPPFSISSSFVLFIILRTLFLSQRKKNVTSPQHSQC